MEIDGFHPLILNVGKAVHNADWNWDNVCSPFTRLYYVIDGKASVTIRDKEVTLTPGNIYVLPSFVPHTTRCEGRFVHYYIHVYEENVVESSSLEDYELPVEVPAFQGTERLFERLVEMNPTMSLPESNPDSYDNSHTLMQSVLHNKMRSDSLRLESRGILYLIFSHHLRHASPKEVKMDRRISDSLRYIHSHLSESLTIEDLSGHVCLSAEYYIRLFRKSLHTTPMDYVNTKRIEKAQLLLLTTDMPVKTIASSLGFVDDSYFVRVFKRLAGMTPTKYRNTPKG